MKLNTREARALAKENLKYPTELAVIPFNEWPPELVVNNGNPHYRPLIAVFRSRTHLVQIYDEDGGILRLSANRTDGMNAINAIKKESTGTPFSV